MLVALLLALRRGIPRWFPVAVGFLLGVLLALRILDVALLAAFYRPFNPLTDWRYVGYGAESLGDSNGTLTAVSAVVAAGLLLLGLLVLTPLAVGRVARVIDLHRRPALRAVAVASLAWLVCAFVGLQVSPDLPVASSSTAGLAAREVTSVRAGLRDMTAFAAQIPVDSFQHVPPADLLGALRGKDVLVIFVESYGRVAVEDSPEVAGALTADGRGLRAAGYASRSAWLTSPTFGG
ncbi:MAG TPA: CDP-alcohol phosphatidyltransferase, partial [Intrasporangium sp.]|nr:CDP-alcohol phosphatidyltransferase [Intrasporangium sp.]